MNQKALAMTYEKAVEGFLLNLHAEGYIQATINIYKWGLAKFVSHIPEDIQNKKKNIFYLRSLLPEI